MASVLKDWIAPQTEKGLSEELENSILRGNLDIQNRLSLAIELRKSGPVQLIDV